METTAEAIAKCLRAGLINSAMPERDDTRESPSLRLIELMEARGASVDYHDPHVPVIPPTREHASLAGRASQAWDIAEISDYDAVLIATDHDGVDFVALVSCAK